MTVHPPDGLLHLVGLSGHGKQKTTTIITKERNMGRAQGVEGNGTGSVTENDTGNGIGNGIGNGNDAGNGIGISETTITATIKTTCNAQRVRVTAADVVEPSLIRKKIFGDNVR